jgi:hypothetical protein
MSNPRVDALKDMFAYSTQHTAGLAEKFPADKRLVQIKPGKGHALWQIGHVAVALDTITNCWLLGDKMHLSPQYNKKFSPGVMGGDDPSPDAGLYPPWDEVLENYKKAAARTVELLGGISDADLPGELRGPVPDQARSFFGKLGQGLTGMAMHDSHHHGQLALLKGFVS